MSIPCRTIRQFILEYCNRHTSEYNEGNLNRSSQRLLDVEMKYISNHLKRFCFTFDFLPRVENARVLDVGIGQGFLDYCIKKVLNYEVTGVDAQREETESWRRRLTEEGIQFKLCDISQEPLPFDEASFDIVLFLEVIEHLFPPRAFLVLKEINRVLKPGGFLVMSTPNQAGLGHRLGLLIGRSVLNLEAYFHQDGATYGHIFEYTGSQLQQLLTTAEFHCDSLEFKDFYRQRMIVRLLQTLESSRMRDSVLIRAYKASATGALEGPKAVPHP